MLLKQLSVSHVRNIDSTSLSPTSGINLLVGDNGSGKTSLLESIQLLSSGRSFRTHNLKTIIQHQQKNLFVTGALDVDGIEHRLGIEIGKEGNRARLNHQNVKSLSQLSRVFPVLSIHPASFQLLNGEPSHRRSFLDWGIFFENLDFLSVHQRYRLALSQRNAALRNRRPDREVSLWHEELDLNASRIADWRAAYLDSIFKEAIVLAEYFDGLGTVSTEFSKGWKGESLGEQLNEQIERDRRLGYTYSGAHRSDFCIKIDGVDIGKFGSRGQIKRIILILKLAQINLFIQHNGTHCVLLIDDLMSELDEQNIESFSSLLTEIKLQTFVTASNESEWSLSRIAPSRMFHVKHGRFEVVV